MDVIQIKSSTQICEVAHDMEQSLMRVRFHQNGRARDDYFEFVDVPRSVFDEIRRLEDDARFAGKQFGKAEKPQNVGRYYHGTVRAMFIGVRVMPNGGRRPLG
jgi:KTSC domain